MIKTREEILELFARRVAGWLAEYPAEVGRIRERVCVMLKFTAVEFTNWIRTAVDGATLENLEKELQTSAEQRAEGLTKNAANNSAATEMEAPPEGLMDGVNEEDGLLDLGIVPEGEEDAAAAAVEVENTKATRADWLDTQLPLILRAIGRKEGSERAGGVAWLFRQLALNLKGRDAPTEALVRDLVCHAVRELKKTDYDRCIRESRALLAEKDGKASAAADGDATDLGGLARKFLGDMGADRALARWRENWFEWRRERAFYALKSKEWMSTQLTIWMLQHGLPAGGRMEENLTTVIRAICFVEEEVRPPCWLPGKTDEKIRREGSTYISMANGILDLESVRFEIGDVMAHAPLIEHTPDFFTLNGLPYEFQPDATCPELDKALQQWQPKGEDDPEGMGQRVMQEFTGYVLEPGQPRQVMMLNHGPGEDGKSQFREIVTAMVGPDNTSNLGLEALDPSNVNGREDLLGKMLWTVPDANQIEKLGEGTLKAITGGDRVAIARKFKSVVNGVLDAKVMMNCNELPGFRDRSEGIWRRLLMLNWRPMTGPKIVNFATKLIQTEMPGIFIWALRGWRRVHDVGFSRQGVLLTNVQKFRFEVQHELKFFDECVAIAEKPVGELDQVSNAKLMKAYVNWCKRGNIKPYAHPETMGRSLARWVRWQLEASGWAADDISEFLKESNFKRRRKEPGKKRTDFYVRIELLEDDEAEVVEEQGGYKQIATSQKRTLPTTLYDG